MSEPFDSVNVELWSCDEDNGKLFFSDMVFNKPYLSLAVYSRDFIKTRAITKESGDYEVEFLYGHICEVGDEPRIVFFNRSIHKLILAADGYCLSIECKGTKLDCRTHREYLDNAVISILPKV